VALPDCHASLSAEDICWRKAGAARDEVGRGFGGRAAVALRAGTGAGAHLALALGRLPGCALAGRAADVVFAGLELLAALGAEGELGAVTALLAAAAHIGRRAEVHLQAPQLREAAVASLRDGAGRGVE
jgi:hypothetical protein